MRTITPVLVVLALGVSGMMLGATGFAGAWGTEPPKTDAAQEQVKEQAEDLSPRANESNGDEGDDGPISGPVNSGESSIVGLVVDAVSSVTSLAGAVLLLPVTLINLGFPAWFAVPIGGLAELIVGIGVIQFATGREFR